MVALFACVNMRGQIIDFSDANFKAKLLQAEEGSFIAFDSEGNTMKIDGNEDGEIELNEALAVHGLNVYPNISNLSGIEFFTNLKSLYIPDNNLSGIVDFSPLINLTYLNCNDSFNLVTTNGINISGLNLKTLYCNNNKIISLNLSDAPNLEFLDCSWNQMLSLDVSSNPLIKELSCSFNNLSSLELEGLTELTKLSCNNNVLESLNLSDCLQLDQLYCSFNDFINLDLVYSSDLSIVSAGPNYFLENAFIKGNTNILFNLSECPSLKYLCVDDSKIEIAENLVTELGYTDCEVNSYCSFTPGGEYYTINGTNILDSNNNGCDVSDAILPNLKLNITDGTITGSLISNQSGEYYIPVQAGNHTITPVLENPTYFNISPTAVSVTFPETASPFIQNFCITPNGFHQDVEVTIVPIDAAVPGFNAHYKIIYKNKGNVSIAMGTVGLNYNDEVLDFVSANPTSEVLPVGSLFWTFLNLQPFETRTIDVSFNLNSPMETPALNGDDILTFEASADTSVGEDDNPIDNVMNFQQTVVNSFDPNDKTCLEGTAITPDMIGQYVHYMIRFENTGTFAAQNIVVKDMIDTAKFDVSSLIALNGSHPYVTRITGNKVEFMFENINLPFDNANNDGYVVFKIKTLPTLALGDSFSNTASIYFDFNFPIVTEPAVTTFAELGTLDFEFNNYFTLYPNPTNGILNITSKQAIELQTVSIYNTLGQLVVSVPNAKGVNTVDVSRLSTGNYFIKVVSDRGISNAKFVKK